MTASVPQQPERNNDPHQAYTYRDSGAIADYFAQRTAASHAGFFLPHVRPGMRLLDCGCGPGSITVGLAAAVAPGQVVGIDMDATQCEAARARAAASGLTNVRFETGDIYQLPYPDASFDAVFAHGVLDHLREPRKALQECHRVLKPGGLIGVRTSELDGWFVAPPEPLLRQTFDLFLGRLTQYNGGNAQIGKQQRALLRQAGFADIVGSASYESDGTPEATRAWGEIMAAVLLDETLGGQLVALDWVDAETLHQMSAAWQRWGAHPDALLARAWGEAIGWKPDA
jgi:ubiquinone/menaquinone biosynthesis C-methylase UbiE